MASHEKYEDWQECITAAQYCVVECNHCAACCLQEPDVKMMARCIALDTDCSQICNLAIALMSGGSDYVPQVLALCAQVCEDCATECGRHDMDHCQQCAEACRRCAEACRRAIGKA